MSFVLTLSCKDRPGIVAGVANFLADNGFNIRESAQFGDAETDLFFMRVAFEDVRGGRAVGVVQRDFASVAQRFGMDWQIHDLAERPRLLIMVSKFGHCLNDLLYRWDTGALKVEIPAIVANHADWAKRAEAHGIPYHHMPVSAATKPQAEAKLRALIESERIDLVVLARYMQILSPELSRDLAGRAINIHHSFLPSFKGATPYQQAHKRGVKLIGATAHYVTDDLDEGPIIEQETARVDHTMGPEALAAAGRDIESVVLARAVTWHVERRIFINGRKTVVFK